jgi:hypothetical protein
MPQMPAFGRPKDMKNRGFASKKPFVQSGFSVNNWLGGDRR